MTDNPNIDNYKRDVINELAADIISEHLSPDAIEPSTVYEDEAVVEAMEEFKDENLWQDVLAEAVSVLDVLLQRYLDDDTLIDLTLQRRLSEEN